MFCQIGTRERKASHWLRQNKLVDAYILHFVCVIFTRILFKKQFIMILCLILVKLRLKSNIKILKTIKKCLFWSKSLASQTSSVLTTKSTCFRWFSTFKTTDFFFCKSESLDRVSKTLWKTIIFNSWKVWKVIQTSAKCL